MKRIKMIYAKPRYLRNELNTKNLGNFYANHIPVVLYPLSTF